MRDFKAMMHDRILLLNLVPKAGGEPHKVRVALSNVRVLENGDGIYLMYVHGVARPFEITRDSAQGVAVAMDSFAGPVSG